RTGQEGADGKRARRPHLSYLSVRPVLTLSVAFHHRRSACGRTWSWLVAGQAKPSETPRRRRALVAGDVLLCSPRTRPRPAWCPSGASRLLFGCLFGLCVFFCSLE